MPSYGRRIGTGSIAEIAGFAHPRMTDFGGGGRFCALVAWLPAHAEWYEPTPIAGFLTASW
jgi:hypothetical protein